MLLVLTDILEIVLRIYGSSDSQRGRSPDEYLPKLSGRCAGLLIIAPVKEDMDRVEKKFREQRDKEFTKVFILLIFIIFI